MTSIRKYALDVDQISIHFFWDKSTKLKRTEAAIEEYRSQFDTRKPENYGFASMAAVPYAHIVAKMLKGKHPKGTSIELAPNPKDIVRYWFIQPLTITYDLVQIWENMNKSDIEIARKKAIGFWFLALVCFFNTVPLFVISVLANLTAVRGLSDSMRAELCLKGAVGGIRPIP